MPQWGEAGDILGFRLDALAAQMGQRRVHVQSVPEHHHVDHQTQRPKLIFLSLTVALADLATLAVEGVPIATEKKTTIFTEPFVQ